MLYKKCQATLIILEYVINKKGEIVSMRHLFNKLLDQSGKNRKHYIIFSLTCMILLTFTIGGTLAYLTDSESHTNTFTAGDVRIDLIEPNWPGNESPDISNVVPNQSIEKDPAIINTGDNDTVVFMSVSVPKITGKLFSDDGTLVSDGTAEIVEFLNAEKSPISLSGTRNDGWVPLKMLSETEAEATYLLGYISSII